MFWQTLTGKNWQRRSSDKFINLALLIVPLKVLYNVLMLNTVSITDLKQNTASIIKKVKNSGGSLVVLQRSQPAAIITDPDYYQLLEQALEDLEDLRAIEERKNEPGISAEELAKKLGL